MVQDSEENVDEIHDLSDAALRLGRVVLRR
jgi:hypothetical protein